MRVWLCTEIPNLSSSKRLLLSSLLCHQKSVIYFSSSTFGSWINSLTKEMKSNCYAQMCFPEGSNMVLGKDKLFQNFSDLSSSKGCPKDISRHRENEKAFQGVIGVGTEGKGSQ